MGGGTIDFEPFQSDKVEILIFHNSTTICSLLISGKLELDCFLRFGLWIDCLSQENFFLFLPAIVIQCGSTLSITPGRAQTDARNCLSEGSGYITDENNVSEFTYTFLCKNVMCLITDQAEEWRMNK